MPKRQLQPGGRPRLDKTSRPASERAKAFGERLAAERVKRGLSQIELAERAGISHITVSRIETGVRGPGFDMLFVLADALGTTVGALTKGL